MSEDKSFFTEEELKAIKKKAKDKSIIITRWICCIVILVILSLSWYGAEMLFYGYSQPSLVKAFVAVCIAIGLSGRIKKELIWNGNKKEFIEGFTRAIKRNAGDSDSK